MEEDEPEEVWPTPRFMESFTSWDSEFLEFESKGNEKLLYCERDLQYLKTTFNTNKKSFINHLEGIIGCSTLTTTKARTFFLECCLIDNFLNSSIPIFTRLADFLIPEGTPEALNFFPSFRETFLNYITKINNFSEGMIRCVAIPLTAYFRINSTTIHHLTNLKVTFDIVSSSFSSVLSPLQCSFSLKINPIRQKRQEIYRSQLENFSKSVAQIHSIELEIAAIEERRNQLANSSNDLDRLFSILGKIMEKRKSTKPSAEVF